MTWTGAALSRFGLQGSKAADLLIELVSHSCHIGTQFKARSVMGLPPRWCGSSIRLLTKISRQWMLWLVTKNQLWVTVLLTPP